MRCDATKTWGECFCGCFLKDALRVPGLSRQSIEYGLTYLYDNLAKCHRLNSHLPMK